jgi:hypothetical protein
MFPNEKNNLLPETKYMFRKHSTLRYSNFRPYYAIKTDSNFEIFKKQKKAYTTRTPQQSVWRID